MIHQISPLFTSTYKTYINHTDAGGIVYHGNYLTFYENCRRDWFTELGFDGYFITDEATACQTSEGKNTGHKKTTYHPVVSQVQIRYKRPILLDMKIQVTIDAVAIKPASLIFNQSIYDENMTTLLSTTQMTIACVLNETDLKTGKKTIKPTRLPAHLVTAIEQWQ